MKETLIHMIEAEYRELLGQKIVSNTFEIIDENDIPDMRANSEGVFKEKPKQSDFLNNLTADGFEDLNLRD